MQELAQFKPILNNLQDRVSQYYEENQVEVPDNTYFSQYFQVPEYISPRDTVSSDSDEFDAAAFFLGGATRQDKPRDEYVIKEDKEESNPLDFDVQIGNQDSIAYRHNNPGNLMYVGQKGAVRGESRGSGYWAKFNSPEEGFKALVNDLKAKQSGRTSTGLSGASTLIDLMHVYAPPHENNTGSYIDKIARNLNVSKHTSIKNLNMEKLAKIIAKYESSTIIE